MGTRLRQIPSSSRRHGRAGAVHARPATQSLSRPGSRPCRPQVRAALVSGSRQQPGQGCLGKAIRGWSLEEFHRQAELNFTEEDVHEVAAHLLCHLGDQVPFRTDQDPLRVG